MRKKSFPKKVLNDIDTKIINKKSCMYFVIKSAIHTSKLWVRQNNLHPSWYAQNVELNTKKKKVQQDDKCLNKKNERLRILFNSHKINYCIMYFIFAIVFCWFKPKYKRYILHFMYECKSKVCSHKNNIRNNTLRIH